MFDHPWSGVAYNFGRVCLSVCLSVGMYVCQMIIIESLDVGYLFLHIGISQSNTGQDRIWRSSDQGQGHRSKRGRKSVSPQCKTSIGNNSSSTKHKAVKFACSMAMVCSYGHARHLCHVTGSEHAYLHARNSRAIGHRSGGSLVHIYL